MKIRAKVLRENYVRLGAVADVNISKEDVYLSIPKEVVSILLHPLLLCRLTSSELASTK